MEPKDKTYTAHMIIYSHPQMNETFEDIEPSRLFTVYDLVREGFGILTFRGKHVKVEQFTYVDNRERAELTIHGRIEE